MLMINGEWRAGSGERWQSRNPVTQETVWDGHAANAAEVDAAVANARAAFKSWARQEPEARLAVARNFAELLKTNQAMLAETIGQETGKPRWEALTEVTSMINKVDISIRALDERTGSKQAPQRCAGRVAPSAAWCAGGVRAV